MGWLWGREAGWSRRSFLKLTATVAVSGLLPGATRAQDVTEEAEEALSGAAVEAMAKHLAGVPVGPEEARGYAPGIQNFAALIRRMPLAQEVEPPTVYVIREE